MIQHLYRRRENTIHMPTVTRRALVVSISSLATDSTTRSALYRILHSVAFRYSNMWVLSPYVTDDLVQKIVDFINSIPGASVKLLNIQLDAGELAKYLERRLTELESKQKYPYHRAELRIVRSELVALKTMLSNDGGSR